MAVRNPLVQIDGNLAELPVGDSLYHTVTNTDYEDEAYAYIQNGVRITRIDYTVSPPLVGHNYTGDWLNRQNLAYTPAG